METKLKIKLAPPLRDSAPVIVELGLTGLMCKGIELVFARDYKHNNNPPQVDIPNGCENTWQGQP